MYVYTCISFMLEVLLRLWYTRQVLKVQNLQYFTIFFEYCKIKILIVHEIYLSLIFLGGSFQTLQHMVNYETKE